MAKKKQTKKVEDSFLDNFPMKESEETVVAEQPIVKEKPLKVSKNTWEIKDRVYYLKNKKKPLSYIIKSQDIYWFDEEKGYERELKYCENQRTPFVDEMKGEQRLAHIIFRNGALHVPKEKVILQRLMSLYHPLRDKLWYEWKPAKQAAIEVDILELETDALLAARNLDVDMMEAVMRAEIGSEVSRMSSKELKRDLLIFAKNNPVLFLELVNDENVVLRNFGIRATEAGILNLSSDQRTFSWGSNNRKLMNVPFDEHPYTALAHWFKTDEGMEIYSNIEKRLK